MIIAPYQSFESALMPEWTDLFSRIMDWIHVGSDNGNSDVHNIRYLYDGLGGRGYKGEQILIVFTLGIWALPFESSPLNWIAYLPSKSM